MFSFFKKEKWAHVYTKTGGGLTWCKGTENEKTGGKLYIHLFESDKGNRRIEAACTFTEVSQESVDIYLKTTSWYQEKIVRWLAGRYDPEFPRYADIPEEDTANALRGKVG